MMNANAIDILRRVEEESAQLNRHVEFKQCFEFYRAQTGVRKSIRLALEDMNLQNLYEELLE